MTPDELSDRLLDFAIAMGRIADALPDTRLGRHIAEQLVRCGTSPAPNYEEGCGAESKADFVHKIGICLKELRESRLWLRMILRAQLLPPDSVQAALDECTPLTNIMGRSRLSARGLRSAEHPIDN